MKTLQNNLLYLSVVIALVISSHSVLADDLNPPLYRGDPLSVFAHWTLDPSGVFGLSQFSWVDDSDPSTTLYPFIPYYTTGTTSGTYDFRIPNFVDEEPIKFLRIQLTWIGTTQPPLGITSTAWENNVPIPGIVTFASSPLVFTQPDGGYQFFDIEYQPNPDFENIQIYLPPDASLVQVVVDTVSTVPEPATMALLALGGLLLRKRK